MNSINTQPHNGTLSLIKGKNTMMTPTPIIKSRTDNFYKPEHIKDFKFKFTNCLTKGTFIFDHHYSTIRPRKKTFKIKNIFLINKTGAPIQFNLRNHDSYNYMYLVFIKKTTNLYTTQKGVSRSNLRNNIVIGFSHSLEDNPSRDFDKDSILRYGFRDGSSYFVQCIDSFDASNNIIANYRINTISGTRFFKEQTNRILQEMIDYYQTDTSLTHAEKIYFISLLFNKLKDLSKRLLANQDDFLAYTIDSLKHEMIKSPNISSNSHVIATRLEQSAESLESSNVHINNEQEYKIIKNSSSLVTNSSSSVKDLNLPSSVESKTDSFNEDSMKIVEEFRDYSTDLVKMMNRPILVNFMDPFVKKFNVLCLEVEHNQSEITYFEFLSEWNALKSYADTQKTSHFNNQQKQSLKDAKTMLDKALNHESTDNEKQLSSKGLISTLEGVLPMNNDVISWLKHETGLKELLP